MGTQALAVGLTGTRKGMTSEQIDRIRLLFLELMPAEFRHGMDDGADSDGHVILRSIPELASCRIVGHPPINKAHSTKHYTGADACDELMPELNYLARDHELVKAVDILLATPDGYVNIPRGSGTWATIRAAHKLNVTTFIVFPDGSVERRDPAC